MKTYNRIIIFSLIIYGILAFLSGNALLNVENNLDNGYRIESHRMMNSLTDINSIQNIDISQYEYIKEIDFLDAHVVDSNLTQQFYAEETGKNILIKPFYQDNQLQGYIKMIYQAPHYDSQYIFMILQMSLIILEVSLLVILFYMKKHVISPFQRLSELPMQLAKGHFQGEVKEEKSRYFGKFMWGMSQLKDQLETSRKRELELGKEKKKMLLSLSHDMKTPLNLIKLYAKALKENIYQDKESKQNALIQIENKTSEIEKYIDEIIQSSREDILDLKVENSEFYLRDLMNDVLSIYKEQCDLRHIQLIVHDYENKLLKGDRERSQEVFENLFENVFKYGDGKRIEIFFEEEDYCQLIRIYNTGKTVNENEFNHIFESFFRGGNSQGQQGSGLGLYICRELMSKMDGAIFASIEEEGMSFTLVFR